MRAFGWLDSIITGFASSDADRLFYGIDENLAITNFVSARCTDNGGDGGVNHVICQDDFDFHLWQKIHDIFGPAV